MPKGVFKRTKEHGRNISKAKKGKKRSDMIGNKLCVGREPWNKNIKGYTNTGSFKKGHKTNVGIVRLEETRKKVSLAKLKRKKELGYVNSPETRKKMSEAQKKLKRSKDYYREKGLIGLKKQASMKNPTSIEKKVYDELKRRGLLFEKQKLINGRFLVDAYIPSLNLVIEADGSYWHSLPKTIKKDKIKNVYLKKCGFNLLRLPGSEIRDGSFKQKLSEEMN